jgi:hypothetical protein
MTLLLRRLCRRYGRRLGCALLLVTFTLTAAGVPLPAGTSSKKGRELFPCSTCKCGCASAEQCWKDCCCHTLAQRLAWAREHGVEPPAFALAEARSIGLLADQLASKSCCKKQNQDAPNCCKRSHSIASSERSCCRKQIEQPTVSPEDDRPDSTVVGWRAMKCRGQTMNWLGVVPTTVVTRLTWLQRPSCVAWLGPAISEHGEGITVDPAVPPPERA